MVEGVEGEEGLAAIGWGEQSGEEAIGIVAANQGGNRVVHSLGGGVVCGLMQDRLDG